MTANEKLQKIRLFLLDLDGTLYIGGRLFEFTKELLSVIRRTGRRYLFMTNNSSKSVKDYIAKLSGMGIAATEDDFITSSQATAEYLCAERPNDAIYVCGTRSLRDELCRADLAVTDDADRADCIVMGFDTELTFRKLDDVSRALSTRNVGYIATNPDLVCPTEYGSVPDCGSVCDMIFNATHKRPFVIGKPSQMMPLIALRRTGFSKDETAVVGDRIYTDIKSGINAGVTSVLVLSGETTEQILHDSPDKPDIVLDSCEGILSALRSEL